ncbi:MAG TPA: succinate dehydrogenase cytochrome b subunit [Opitutaceae bacterium]|jgi:succinate dehydrogenase / fumarate reductase cytochrome b subunit|nr:succinate dehydrogenase cytochrome b subunit [Opitutaceae bacterium]
MNLAGRLFCTTLGRKLLVAVTGFFLILFVVGHLIGNLQVFEDPDKINGYAQFLRSLGPGLWIERIGLLACAVIHIWAATTLAIADRQARGGQPYKRNRWLEATFASRYMRWTGYVVLAFVLYHLAQFTWGGVQRATFKENLPPYTMVHDYTAFGFVAVPAGAQVLDVRTMVILGFQNPVVAVFYIIAVGLLSLHLLHGAESLCQTLGWRSSRWSRGLRAAVALGCAAYFLGNLSIPGAVLAGALRPAPFSAAARR